MCICWILIKEYIFLFGHGGSLIPAPNPGGLDLISEFPVLGGLVSLT
jgi:hypothetical protein